ncbi:hypothetical protein FS837_013066 [Tulasnella sp. UAMH 9824]|nr:hypothetical protein FS837_013066 [Tulasnella sp. UAMH 9824]
MTTSVSDASRSRNIRRVERETVDWLRSVRKARMTKEQLDHGDRRIQNECYKNFEMFYEKVQDLNHRFDAFMKAIRPFGSSSGLINTARQLQDSFDNVLQDFRANSAEIWREFSLGVGSNELPKSLVGWSAESAPDKLPVLLAEHMKTLSILLDHYLEGLNEIPEFSDKPLADVLMEFKTWLDCRAERILSHARSPLVRKSIVRHYMGQVMNEMSLPIAKIKDALEDFVTQGVTAIRNAQDNQQGRLQNMSAVATFLSAVTATTMQYDVQKNGLGTVVMGLWISSLILSIASAINSQLAIHWRAAIYGSPRSALPLWMTVCLDQTPLVCLSAAVLAFSIGLVIWTIAFDLALPVKICAAVITCATFVVLITVGLWEVKEWWTRTERSKKATQAQDNAEPQTETHPRYFLWRDWRKRTLAETEARDESPVVAEPQLTTVGKLLLGWNRLIRLISGPPLLSPPPGNVPQYSVVQILPDGLPPAAGPGTAAIAQEASASGISMTSGLYEGDYEYEVPELDERIKRYSAALPLIDPLNGPGEQRPPTPKVSSVRQRFQNAVSNLINDPQLREILVTMPSLPLDYHGFQLEDLEKLRPAYRLQVFHPAGYDMHFSPDGKYLGVGCIDGTVAIWEVGRLYAQPKVVLTSPRGRFGWSPDGSRILLIMKQGATILKAGSWNTRCSPRATGPIRVVAWLQSSCAITLVIDDVLHVFDTELQPRTPYAPVRLPIEVHDVASIPHSSRGQYGFVLVVGSLFDDAPKKGRQPNDPKIRVNEPSLACAEHWLMGKLADASYYDSSRKYEHIDSAVIDLDAAGGGRSVAEAPTLADARHICVSKDGHHAIISYADGSCPEVWKLRNKSGKMQLLFRGRFTPMDPGATQRNGDPIPTTSGKARFCGKSDEWVMATDGQSNIYIWDRFSRHLVHTLKGSQIGAKFENYSDISAVTSTVKRNRKASPIVVSACTRGGVVVWEYPDEQEAHVEPGSGGETSKAGATNSESLQ